MPFLVLKYKLLKGRRYISEGEVYTVVGRVDSAQGPAVAVPVSARRDSYVELDLLHQCST